LTPLANAMLLSLEQQYSRPAPTDSDRVDGMIVLGGMIDSLVSVARNEVALNEAAERLTEAAALARRYPGARIVISGGDGSLVYRSTDEAGIAKRFLTQIGIDPARITLETRSRNTWQNAVFTKKLIAPKPGERWLLITSAFHMPRAMGCFRAAGFDVIAWPVDFRTRGLEDLLRFSSGASGAWSDIDLAANEWVGYLAYWITGRLK
ncbi:MAG: YdcF family protein, partial [Rhodomicrobiaceae bacterium]